MLRSLCFSYRHGGYNQFGFRLISTKPSDLDRIIYGSQNYPRVEFENVNEFKNLINQIGGPDFLFDNQKILDKFSENIYLLESYPHDDYEFIMNWGKPIYRVEIDHIDNFTRFIETIRSIHKKKKHKE